MKQLACLSIPAPKSLLNVSGPRLELDGFPCCTWGCRLCRLKFPLTSLEVVVWHHQRRVRFGSSMMGRQRQSRCTSLQAWPSRSLPLLRSRIRTSLSQQLWAGHRLMSAFQVRNLITASFTLLNSYSNDALCLGVVIGHRACLKEGVAQGRKGRNDKVRRGQLSDRRHVTK